MEVSLRRFCFRLICYALFLIFIMLLFCFLLFSFFPVLCLLLPTVELTLGIYVICKAALFLYFHIFVLIHGKKYDGTLRQKTVRRKAYVLYANEFHCNNAQNNYSNFGFILCNNCKKLLILGFIYGKIIIRLWAVCKVAICTISTNCGHFSSQRMT